MDSSGRTHRRRTGRNQACTSRCLGRRRRWGLYLRVATAGDAAKCSGEIEEGRKCCKERGAEEEEGRRCTTEERRSVKKRNWSQRKDGSGFAQRYSVILSNPEGMTALLLRCGTNKDLTAAAVYQNRCLSKPLFKTTVYQNHCLPKALFTKTAPIRCLAPDCATHTDRPPDPNEGRYRNSPISPPSHLLSYFSFVFPILTGAVDALNAPH